MKKKSASIFTYDKNHHVKSDFRYKLYVIFLLYKLITILYIYHSKSNRMQLIYVQMDFTLGAKKA